MEGINEGRSDYSTAKSSEPTGHSAASLSKALSPEMKRLVASGKAVIHDTADTLPKGKHPENVQGLTTADGVTHYVADRLTPESLENVALHEVGVHVGMEKLVGPEVYADITRQAMNNVGAAFDAARAAIPKDTPTHLRHHEALAYLVENSPQLPIVKKIVSAVRNFARTHLGMKVALTEADARQLAVTALRRESKTSERTARKEAAAYSVKGPNQTAQQIGAALAAEDLVKTSDKSFNDSVVSAVEAVKNMPSKTATLRAKWIDATAGLSKALRNLPQFSLDGVLRADFLLQANEQLYNVIRNARGYLTFSTDGTLMSVLNERLSLQDIFKRIDALGYADARKVFFSAMRVLTGEESLRKDVEGRANAKKYKDFAGVLGKDALTLQAAEVDLRRAIDATKDAAKLKSLKEDLAVATAEHKRLKAKIIKLNKRSKELYVRHGKVSAVQAQAAIDSLVAQAQAKKDKADITTDSTARKKLLEAADALTARADAAIEKLDRGVGTEKLVTAEQIAEVRALLAADPRLEVIMNDIWDGLRSLVDLSEASGMIDSHVANDWRANPSYVPLYKSMEDIADEPSKYMELLRTGATRVGKVKARKGSTQIVNVGENIVKHWTFMAAAATENNARRIATEQMEQVGLATRLKVGPKGAPEGGTNTMFMVEGKEVWYRIDDPLAFEAFQTMIPVLPAWVKVAKKHTDIFRVATLVNPLYWYRQLIRDPLMASLVTQTGLITPFNAMFQMAKILAKRSEGYNELNKRGIVGVVDSLEDPAQFAKSMSSGKKNFLKSPLVWAKDKLMHIHESTDAATRVAVYEAAYKSAPKRGIVDEQQRKDFAASQAREVINFAKKGNLKSLASIRAVIPFFSAQLNGMDTLARAAAPDKYGNLNKADAAIVRKHFYANAAMLTSATIAYTLAMQDDDEYLKSPDWMNSWLVHTGEKDFPFLKVPIPFEAGFFFKVLPEIAVRLSSGTLTQQQASEAMRIAATNLLLPPALPQLLKPVSEVVMNHDLYTGRSIDSFADELVGLNQRTGHASFLSKALAKGIPDFMNLSPNKVEHLGKGWFTEAWAMSSLLAENYLNTSGVSAPTKEIGQMMLLKGAFTAPDRDRAVNEFYALSKASKEIVNGIRQYKKSGTTEEAIAMRDDPENTKILAVSTELSKIMTMLNRLGADKKYIKGLPDSKMSPDEKAKSIRKLDQRRNELARMGVGLSDRAGVKR